MALVDLNGLSRFLQNLEQKWNAKLEARDFTVTATIEDLTATTATVDKSLSEIEAAYQTGKNLSCIVYIPGNFGASIKLTNVQRFTSNGSYVFSGMGMIYTGESPQYVSLFLHISSNGVTVAINHLAVEQTYTDIALTGTWILNKRYDSSFNEIDADGHAIFKSGAINLIGDPSVAHLLIEHDITSDSTFKEIWWEGTSAKVYEMKAYKNNHVSKGKDGSWQYDIGYVNDLNTTTNYHKAADYDSITNIGFCYKINSSRAITEEDIPSIKMTIGEDIA